MSPNLKKDATVYSKQQLFASWGLKYLLTSFFIISEFCRSRVIIIERVIKLQHSLISDAGIRYILGISIVTQQEERILIIVLIKRCLFTEDCLYPRSLWDATLFLSPRVYSFG